ncbi:DUF6538 domain-containing protein [Methylobacterium durans]|uniref:DUF6538 domain-containing protein n=1 Tax=Methylobacterium durans TaxID=2202825 RepID=UPI001881E101|nr:DUF6538 domain-containing protein [Methylobacterium durans]
MKRKGTSFHQFVQRIPADVAAKVRGMKLAIPVGEGVANLIISEKAKDIRTSLRTRDPQEAKSRQAAAVAYLEGLWRSVREGPRRLTHKETVALAGEVYRAWTEPLEDNPGPVERWVRAEVENLRAEFGRRGRAALMILPDDERSIRSIEERVGGFSDALVAKRGLLIDAESCVGR